MKMRFLLLFFLSFASNGQDLQRLSADAKKAHDAKNYRGFLAVCKTLDSLRPAHPVFTYNLACAYALDGQPARAIAAMKKAVLMNDAVAFENDDDFSSVFASGGFEEIRRLKESLAVPVVSSEEVAALSEKDLHPEGLVYLSKSRTWLATSVRKGKIVSFDPASGLCRDWLAADGVMPVMSIKADQDEKYLWAATAALPQWQDHTPETRGRAEVLMIDIGSKKIMTRFALPGSHVFGDLAISPAGEIYVSDSDKPVIYRIANREMREWLDLESQAFNLQGLTFAAGGQTIYIADYLKGIAAIDVASRSVMWLPFPDGTVAKGIDGLTWFDGSLIAVHNGVTPIRIMRYGLSADGRHIDAFEVLDHNRPAFDQPTLGTVHDGYFYFFANNPWSAYDAASRLDASKLEFPALYRLRLK
jgi:hypothetical protein